MMQKQNQKLFIRQNLNNNLLRKTGINLDINSQLVTYPLNHNLNRTFILRAPYFFRVIAQT